MRGTNLPNSWVERSSGRTDGGENAPKGGKFASSCQMWWQQKTPDLHEFASAYHHCHLFYKNKEK
jgi:hypothetical protein